MFFLALETIYLFWKFFDVELVRLHMNLLGTVATREDLELKLVLVRLLDIIS